MEAPGWDGTGNETYASPKELWQRVEGDKDAAWYTPAVAHWDKQPATYDGVLAGLGHLNGCDIAESRSFLKKAFARQLEAALAGERRLVGLDCGAGVGRVTEQLLLSRCAQVDLIEPSAHLLNAARATLAPSASSGDGCSSNGGASGERRHPPGHAAADFFQMGLQAFTPAPGRYDLVWMQWALLYLTDDDALAFFERLKAGMKPDGLIVIKENVCAAGFVVDKEDSSLTRSNQYLLQLFKRAGLVVMYNVLQRSFPKELFKVRMYALRFRARS
ncbi:hypothetical protein WJX81_003944 [Elliptochloris bilobata]|uniref:Alpha N-terminal protein methyltransferase 1 n=1 Tax=Elliptochloris bilobata TaxID=381761 RepID=A0AAW1S4T4_9CHLO